MNEYDVQMDDDEETKSVCDAMFTLQGQDAMGAQSDFEKPQSEGKLFTEPHVQDDFDSNSWLAMRNNT